MRLLIALLCLAFTGAAPAAASPEVSVTVSRAKGGDWIVDYSFRRKAPVWFFQRSNADLDGKPWRPASWTVETRGVRLERVGRYDILTAENGTLSKVRIRMRPFAEPLTADYTPALRFSDGGLAFYSEHFLIAPAASRAAVEALPADLNGVPHDMAEVALSFRDPGKRLLLRGKATRGRAALTLGEAGGYIYDGNAPVTETEAFAGVIDAGLPGWIRTELDDFTPRLMRLYTEKLGKPTGGRPMALVAWQGADRNGYSMGGSVLQGMVVMQISGKQVLTPNPQVLTRMRWFIGHESAHFWIGQTIGYTRRSEGWITEGGADLLAIRAFQQLSPEFDARAELQREVDECLALNGPGEPLGTAEERGEHRASYSCGALLLLAADSAARRTDPGADVFTFLRALIDAHRESGKVTGDDWLGQFEKVAGPAAAAEVRGFVREGVADPRAFWIKLFGATGVGVAAEGDKLRLL